jgi:hypothetical protein
VLPLESHHALHPAVQLVAKAAASMVHPEEAAGMMSPTAMVGLRLSACV